LGTAQLQKVPRPLAAVLTWAGIAGILLAGLTLSIRDAFPGYIAMLPVASAALVIAGGTASPRWGVESVLGTLPFRWIGRWSFSWYLWQPVVLVVAVKYLHMNFGLTAVPRAMLLALIALALAAATYFLVENPFRHSKWLRQNPGATLVGAALLVASCILFTYAL
jgi:peptidoglycan/LPS O-acetylase OafA/YrhL